VTGVSVGGGGDVSVAVGISVGVSVDVGVSVTVGDGETVGVREGGMNAVEVTVGAGTAVAEAGLDVGVDAPSVLPGARRIAINPAQ